MVFGVCFLLSGLWISRGDVYREPWVVLLLAEELVRLLAVGPRLMFELQIVVAGDGDFPASFVRIIRG